MAIRIGRAILTVLIGLFMGGLFASFAVAAAPPEWRGPWIPLVAGLVGVVLTALVRRLGQPGRPGPPDEDDRP